jgi:hypothetical protein
LGFVCTITESPRKPSSPGAQAFSEPTQPPQVFDAVSMGLRHVLYVFLMHF